MSTKPQPLKTNRWRLNHWNLLGSIQSASQGVKMIKTPRIERVSVDDLMSLATDQGTTPMQVGVILMMDTSAGLDTARFIDAINRRLPAIPRLRQCLVDAPFGCGRPIWVDDADFKITSHVSVKQCPTSAGMDVVLELAAGLLTTRLSRDRSLWAAILIPDVNPDQSALVLIVHHVLADGIAGLAILAGLVDGASEVLDPQFPRRQPTRAALFWDALSDNVRALRQLPATLVRFGQALTQLGPALRSRPVRSSLNRITGSQRRFAAVGCVLADIHTVAHQHGGTVNDVMLSAITGALHRLLMGRGEPTNGFVVSIPFSARQRTTAQKLGNQSGVIPLWLPGTGTPLERLSAVAGITRTAKTKTSARGASTALLVPLFRLLSRIGLFQWFIEHQRSIQTFVSSMKGPVTTLSVDGFPILDLVPLSVAIGNVTVSFVVLSYAGKLTVTLSADPESCPDLSDLQTFLIEDLESLTKTLRA